MELHTDDLAIDGRTRREQEVENFKKTIEEDAKDDKKMVEIDQTHTGNENALDIKHTGNEKALDDKYFKITNDLMDRCLNLEKGETDLDTNKASKALVLYLFKELDDKAVLLDEKKASKKHVKETFGQLSQLIQSYQEQTVKTITEYHDDLVKVVNDNSVKMNDKAERVALGTDMDTIRQAVTQVLQEQGIIKRTDPSVPDIKGLDKASDNASQMAAIDNDEDSKKQAAEAAADQLGLPKEG